MKFTFGWHLFRQVIDTLIGTNCAPLFANLFLYSDESNILDNMIGSGYRILVARSFNPRYRYNSDLKLFSNKKSEGYVKDIYLPNLLLKK